MRSDLQRGRGEVGGGRSGGVGDSFRPRPPTRPPVIGLFSRFSRRKASLASPRVLRKGLLASIPSSPPRAPRWKRSGRAPVSCTFRREFRTRPCSGSGSLRAEGSAQRKERLVGAGRGFLPPRFIIDLKGMVSRIRNSERLTLGQVDSGKDTMNTCDEVLVCPTVKRAERRRWRMANDGRRVHPGSWRCRPGSPSLAPGPPGSGKSGASLTPPRAAARKSSARLPSPS